MNKIVKLKESDIKNIVRNIINEQSDLDEYGVKGMYKPVWNEEDQTLAMYNSLYGIEELGVTKEEVATDIIGTSLASFNKQTSNFDYLSGRGGLDRPHKLQTALYEKLKGVPHEELKNHCLNIIEKRLENPESSVSKLKLGKEIGNKRTDITKTREDLIRKQGHDPNKLKILSQRPKFEPSFEDDEPMNEPTPKKTSKDEIKSFLEDLYRKAVESNPELADDIQFISDYIDSELVDKGTLSEIRQLFKVTINENKINKMKKVIRIKESDIKNIVKKIINEQGFDGNGFPEGDESQNDDYTTDEPEERSNTEFTDEEMSINKFESSVLDLMDMGYSPIELTKWIQDLNLKYFKNHVDSHRQERMMRNQPDANMNENKNPKKVIRIKESEIKDIVKRLIKK